MPDHPADGGSFPENRYANPEAALGGADAVSKTTYVAGEETSAVRYIMGGPAKPTDKPPRPFEAGVEGRPTLVANVAGGTEVSALPGALLPFFSHAAKARMDISAIAVKLDERECMAARLSRTPATTRRTTWMQRAKTRLEVR